uniref:Transmembrane protein n=1 Tax=Bionectria ochroleuca TaxID=29856 RepID=A0A8H7MZQ8_BIOOC
MPERLCKRFVCGQDATDILHLFILAIIFIFIIVSLGDFFNCHRPAFALAVFVSCRLGILGRLFRRGWFANGLGSWFELRLHRGRRVKTCTASEELGGATPVW